MAITLWLQQQSSRLPGVQYVELRHCEVSGRTTPIQRWPIPANDQARNDVESELWTVAQTWTDNARSGPQRFTIALVDGAEQILGQHMITCATNTLGGSAWDTEPASMEGVTKQLMRHTEAMTKVSVGATSEVLSMLRRDNEQLRDRVAQLEARHLETMESVEALISLRHERDLDTLRVERQQTRRDQMAEKLGLLIPAAASKLTGGGQAAPDPALKALATSFSAEQTEAIARHLRPEQLVAFATLLERHANPRDEQPSQDASHAQ